MQEPSYSKIDTEESESLTPKAVPTPVPTSIEPVIETYVKYYTETDKKLVKQLQHGMSLAESSGDDLKHALMTIVTLVMYKLSVKSDDIKQKRNITCMITCVEELLKTVDFDVLDLYDVKETIVKLLGYTLKLHKNVDTYKI